jgi:hypothetical protein
MRKVLRGGACGVMLKAVVNSPSLGEFFAAIEDATTIPSQRRFSYQEALINNRLLRAPSPVPLGPPPARLPDKKCRSSLHHSHSYFSFLALPSPSLIFQFVNCHGHGYAYRHFHSVSFGRHLTRWPFRPVIQFSQPRSV